MVSFWGRTLPAEPAAARSPLAFTTEDGLLWTDSWLGSFQVWGFGMAVTGASSYIFLPELNFDDCLMLRSARAGGQSTM